MNDLFDFPSEPLPDDLRALDEELSDIRYEERASFAPELRAELGRAWAEEPARRRADRRRHLVAAAVVALLLGGASVPSARASLVRLIDVLAPAAAVAPSMPDAIPLAAPAAVSSDEAPLVEPAPYAVPEAVVVASESEPAPDLVGVTEVAPPVVPQLVDRSAAEEILREAYPDALQASGVGGEVRLRLAIDDAGWVREASLAASSGVEALDRIAVDVAPRLRFVPGLQRGEPVGTLIEFPILFEPEPPRPSERALEPVVDPLDLPTLGRSEWWQLDEPLDPESLPTASASTSLHSRQLTDAYADLEQAIDDPVLVDDYGPPSAILEGTAPTSVNPMEWRANVAEALGAAVEEGRGTPASLLALGRIRMRQGVRGEARRLFERGLQMAVREGVAVSPWIVAELHHERGTLIRDGWRASHGVGRVRADAFDAAACPGRWSSGGGSTGFASVERIIMWNYLCPAAMGEVFASGFEARESGAADLTLMMASYRAAIEAYPPHAGANVDLLLVLAEEGRWTDVLRGARRFVRVSGGDADGLLMAGLSLQRLDRPEEAEALFDAALERMQPARADRLRGVASLLGPDDLDRYRRLPRDARRVWVEDYWSTRDRVAATAVNEARVEHLARTAWADLALGGVYGDAGEVWIRFGPPRAIRVVEGGSGRLTEFWDYGSGPDLTFARWISSDRRDLTAEGRAFVDDLGSMFVPE